MKLALLGADPLLIEFLRDLADDGQHQVVWATDVADYWGELREIFPGVALARHWESLLDGNAADAVADAVIVARGGNEDERADQLRKLVQAAVPVLAMQPVFESMLIYYELDMIRRETRGVIVPYLPWREHPAIQRAAELADEGDASAIGRLEQVVMERRLVDRSKREVTSWFARDVDLARVIVGEMARITALGSPDRATAYANLGIQMSGPAGVPVRWSVSPSDAESFGQITLIGSRGKAVVTMPEDAAWEIEVRGGGETQIQDWPDWNPATVAMANLEAAIRGETPAADWEDAVRSVELTETIDRCLEKGRTVELHNETYTEAGTFKGTMTSVGCGLLIVGLGLSLVAAIVEQVANGLKLPGLARLTGGWPYLLLGVMVLFLGLQFAIRLASRSGETDETPRPE